MICKLCGKEAADDALYCEGCGNSFQPVSESSDEQAQHEQVNLEQELPAPDNTDTETVPVLPAIIKSHMVLAIVTTVIFFNWMLGIPAIVFARECELAAERGQFEIAERFSRRAVTFVWVGVALNIAVAAFVALVVVVMMAAGPALLY